MAEAEHWAGDMGKEWARSVEAMDRQLAPASAVGLAELAPRAGEHFLDLGCGGGATTAALCQAVGPDGLVTGVDVSPDLLAVARARPENAGAVFIEGDAQVWPFEPEAHDALFSRFGCMFFGDPSAAYANLHRTLKPGARVVLIVWGALASNPWAALPSRAGAEVLGPADPMPPGTPGPFAWSDPGIFAPILKGAGFADVAWREAPVTLQIGDTGTEDPVARAQAKLLRIGPLARRLKGLPAETRAAVAETLAPVLQPFVRDGWVRMPGLIWVITARA